MQRKDLEHIIRAAGAITNEYEFVIVGSQSLLGAHPEATGDLAASRELDIFSLNNPDLADLIDGSLGEMSPFDATFGYYAHGIDPKTAILPEGWAERLVRVQNGNTRMYTGYCLDPHDLAASKLAAFRQKDRSFVSAMFQAGFLDHETLERRLRSLPVSEDRITAALSFVATIEALPPGERSTSTKPKPR